MGKTKRGTAGSEGEVAGARRYTGDGDSVSAHPHSPSWPQTTQAAPALAAELLNSMWPSKPWSAATMMALMLSVRHGFLMLRVLWGMLSAPVQRKCSRKHTNSRKATDHFGPSRKRKCWKQRRQGSSQRKGGQKWSTEGTPLPLSETTGTLGGPRDTSTSWHQSPVRNFP